MHTIRENLKEYLSAETSWRLSQKRLREAVEELYQNLLEQNGRVKIIIGDYEIVPDPTTPRGIVVTQILRVDLVEGRLPARALS